MPNPFDEQPPGDDWEEHRRRVIGLGEHSFRKSYYPEMKRNEAHVRNLIVAIEQSPRGIFICLRDGTVEYANGTLYTLACCTAEDVVSRPAVVLWKNVIQGDRFNAVRHKMESGTTWRGDLHIRDADGRDIWVQASVAPILNDTGETTHFLGSMEDISARKHMEEELLAVAQARTRALEAAERLSALKSDFISNMSHELRTPIFQILGMAQLGVRATDLDKARDRAQKILESGERLMRIVTSILDFSAAEAGQMKVCRESFEPMELVKELAARWQGRAEAKGLTFELRCADLAVPSIMGDRRRLLQVLEELLTNALKFTQQGSIVLDVASPAGEVQFTIKDTGLGITAEEVDGALKPFQQGDGSSTRLAGGVGIGLPLVNHLVTLMGGRLTVHGTPKVGSEFRVNLPL